MQATHAYQETIKSASNVLAFPGTQTHELPRPIPSPRDSMSFYEVAREMRLDWHKRNAQVIEKLRSLHRHQGMPLPENPRFKSGVPCKGGDNICATSFWSRRKFMAWREAGTERRAAISPAEARNLEARLSRNAAALAGGA